MTWGSGLRHCGPPHREGILCRAVLGLLLLPWLGQSAAFRVATFNVEGYLDVPTETRVAKPPEAKAQVQQSILALQPDVLALQEIGTTNALLELRESLRRGGWEMPYWEYVAGFDTNVHVAILSRFPFSDRRSRTNDFFLLSGRRFRVSRGFGEVDIQVNHDYGFTLLTGHLKSKRAVPQADEAELRLEEAKLLRERIEANLARDPRLNLIVAGDFNDTKDSASTKAVVGKGKLKLIDTRPAERTGIAAASSGPDERRAVTWTHYYGKDDTYSRVDYLLLSPGIAREWVTNATYVLATPNWGLASDHRPLVATFEARDQ